MPRQEFEPNIQRALNNCRVIDKDALSERIQETITTANDAYRALGVPRKSRRSIIKSIEDAIESIPLRDAVEKTERELQRVREIKQVSQRIRKAR